MDEEERKALEAFKKDFKEEQEEFLPDEVDTFEDELWNLN
jgi:hypothetical protein|tara:strand:+ start:1453 stop:1572 length:120 start_codon:yes stop_codon:yes gene_type:complete